MARFFARIFFSRQPSPALAEDDGAVRTMRIAEIKRLLSEIAEATPNTRARGC